MISQMFSVFDRGVKAFAPPFTLPNEQILRRSLIEMADAEMQKPLSQRQDYFRHPADYDVYLIGTLDSESGAVAPVSPVVRVCSMSDFT